MTRSHFAAAQRLLVICLALMLALGSLTGSARADGAAFPFARSAAVAEMIAGVRQADVYAYAAQLSGESAVTVGGRSYMMASRNARCTACIQAATQVVYEFLQAQGVSASYDLWEGVTEDDQEVHGRSVVGVIPGAVRPQEIVLVTAHLDDMPEGSRAPGADDNASGVTAAMMAAERLAGHTFERTVRFVFFTDEEYDQFSSITYAEASRAAGENLVAVYNMDMIGWDGNGDGQAYLETRRRSHPGYASDLAIAEVVLQVVTTYGLDGVLQVDVDPCYDQEVDSRSFWDVGYPSITAIEDFGEEENPNYHTTRDTLSTLNMLYFTSMVKASVGAAAHLAIPVEAVAERVLLPLITK